MYLSVSVAVFALFSDPVDGVEVFIGAQTRQWVLKGVHKFTGAITIHTSSSAAVVIFINSWREEQRGEGHTHTLQQMPEEQRRKEVLPHRFSPWFLATIVLKVIHFVCGFEVTWAFWGHKRALLSKRNKSGFCTGRKQQTSYSVSPHGIVLLYTQNSPQVQCELLSTHFNIKPLSPTSIIRTQL